MVANSSFFRNLGQQLVVIFWVVFCITGCASTSSKTPAGAIENYVAPDDGFFVVPGADFSRYQNIVLPALNFDEVVGPKNVPRVLSDEEKQFFRDQFLPAVVHHLLSDGRYQTSIEAGRDVMIIRARVERIAPVTTAVAEGNHARAMQRYQDEVNTITLSFDINDSSSNALMARLIVTKAIGIVRDDGNWGANGAQIATAFDQAIETLRDQLDELALLQ